MDTYGLLNNNNTGLLTGLSEGIRGGLEAFRAERERKDRLRHLVVEEQRNQEILQRHEQQDKANNVLHGLIPKEAGYQAQPGEMLLPIGKENYAYDPNNTPEIKKEKRGLESAKALAAYKAGLRPDAQGGAAGKGTVAQNAVDKAFAKGYEEDVLAGNNSSAERNIEQVNDALKELQSGKVKTGGLLSALPDFARDYVDPTAKANQDRVRQAVMGSLKATLGAQFTEREGQKIFDLAYNPRQSSQETIKRVGALANQIKGQYAAKRAAQDYYEKNGTLQGYKGPSVGNLEDLYAKPEEKKGLLPNAVASEGPKAGSVVDGYRFKGGDPGDKKNWERQ